MGKDCVGNPDAGRPADGPGAQGDSTSSGPNPQFRAEITGLGEIRASGSGFQSIPRAAGVLPLRHVPGSGAEAVNPLSVFRSVVTELFCGSSNLALFSRSCLRTACPQYHCGARCHTVLGQTWPMPIPYDEVLRRRPDAVEGGELKKLVVNAIVIVLNFLDLGRPCRAPDSCLAGRELGAGQWEQVRRIESFLDAWFQLGILDPEDLGRTAGKLEDLEKAVSELRGFSSLASAELRKRADSSPVGLMKSQHAGTFKEIEADRLQFRGTPDFDPSPYLDETSQQIYKKPFSTSLHPSEFEGKIPRVRVHCNRQERLRLFTLLDKSNRIRLFRRDQVRVQFGAGVFAVLKSLELDRLILDSRPHNLLESPPGRFIRTLGSGELITKILLLPDEGLYASTNDIRDFYHLFRVTSERARRNSFVGSVRPSEVQGLNCFEAWMHKESELYVCLSCLAMGDTQAVEIAQSCHLGLCLQHDIIDESSLLAMSLPIPRKPTFSGIVIDDFVSLSKGKLWKDGQEEMAPATAGAVLADKVQGVYEQVHLIPHQAKATRDQLEAEFWGAQVDGRRGCVRASLKRAAPLLKIISLVVQLGVASVSLLEIIAGGVIALFTFRRRLMSLMSEIFEVMKGKSQQAVIVIGRNLREELLLISLLIPTAVTDLRADFCTEVFAVDASDWGDAVCASRIPVPVARELGRHCLSKGVWTRLLSPYKARARGHGNLDPSEELPGGPEDTFRTHPLWSLLATALKFRVRWKRATRRRRHINVGELRSFLKAERCGAHRGKSSRMLIGGDSQVALGALLKGRSSSASLNRELQKSLPYYIGQGLQPYYMYFPTSINPSDAPTRGRELPEPTEALPSWWRAACEGRFEEMDKWLEARAADPFSLSGLPCLDELRKACSSEVQVQLRFGHLRKFKKLRELLQEGKQSREGAGDASGSRVFPFSSVSSAEGIALPFDSTGTVVWPKGVDKQRCGELPGCIDLCSGNMGYARQLARLTGRWVLCFDVAHNQAQDLVIGEVQNEIRDLLQSGRIAALSASPGSGSFSLASTSGCRTAGYPLGVPELGLAQSRRVSKENQLVEFLFELCSWCYDNGVPFWLENPLGSRLWQLEPVRRLRTSPGVGVWRVDLCAFGAPWKKRTQVLTSTFLAGQETLCPGCFSHHRLRGRSPHSRMSWTKLAENFPKGLSLVLAMAVAGATGDRPEFRRLDACSCARSLSRRVGEASNPGPRRVSAETRAAQRAGQSLGQVALVEPQTQALEERLWTEFVAWVAADSSLETAEHLTSVSATVAPLLREYGDELFQIGSSLSYFRHLLAFAQRKFPDFRMHGRVCWDAVTRWEQLEPLEHRRPLPSALCRAMVALALGWEWPRFALVLLLAFEGIMRIGEVLNAHRIDLVLPSDLFSENWDQMFICIGSPKTRRRGGGRMQHATIRGRALVEAATAVFAELPPTEKLYPLSSQSFRRRWDALLSHLHVGPELNLTPAGVRGGGAIQAYQAGLSVTDLLWRMRLQHVHTLQHYLQELAAENVLSQLSQESRCSIRAASALLPHLLARLSLRCRGPSHGL